MTTQVYQDPLIALLKDPDLNKSKDKTTELISYIDEIDDVSLRNYCIESFEILCDLENISNQINNWDFKTFDFKISQSLILDEEDLEKKKFNTEISKRVITKCLELHKILGKISIEIEELNHFSRFLTPIQRISDPGTILIELIIRNIKLKNKLNEKISIHYSQSRLVTIGIDLENLILSRKSSANYKDDISSNRISEDTVKSYKSFINQLLQQLNDSVEDNDTIGIMECISVVNDVEKMFESMKNQEREDEEDEENEENDNLDDLDYNIGDEHEELEINVMDSDDVEEDKVDIDSEDTLFDESYDPSMSMIINDRRTARNEGNLKVNEKKTNSLHHSTISEALPYLMTAFKDTKKDSKPISNKDTSSQDIPNKDIPTNAKFQQEPLSNSLSGSVLLSSSASDKVAPAPIQTYFTTKYPSLLKIPIMKPLYDSTIEVPNIQEQIMTTKKPIEIITSNSKLLEDSNQNSSTNSNYSKVAPVPKKLDSGLFSMFNSSFSQPEKAPVLKHQEIDANKTFKEKELELSPKKLAQIKVGDGRVKETVKEIETFNKSKVLSGNSTANANANPSAYMKPFTFGKMFGYGYGGTNNGSNINSNTTANALSDFKFHDIDNLID